VTTLKKWINTLSRLAIPEVPRAERRPIPWLAAQNGDSHAPVLARVKDISSSGMYLLTDVRWPVGELVTLVLQAEGTETSDPEMYLPVRARVVRCGEDGVGLAFVLQEGLEPRLWEALVNYAFIVTTPKDKRFSFCMLRAVLFVCRLCRLSSSEPLAVLGGEMNEARTASVLKIVLRTEELLALEVNARRKRAHPRLVARILREGSWVTDELSLALWTGLLVSSCGADAADVSNDKFVDLLIHVTPPHARILAAGCSRAGERMADGPGASVPEVVVPAAEMFEITGSRDIGKITLDMAYMYQYGLLADLVEASSYLPTESFRITPSARAMELFRRCRP
jgi:hypothetical protein